ncbi:MAG: hypothetical protein NPIRA06_05480 [Nitrospirales bacterium]|nr:MAG: hypothetical protein NPIRA06_05480 [Nitrospirales bacterium]
MNKTNWKPYGPYEGLYHNFYEASQDARGYNFGEGPVEKVAPPTVNDLNSLTWWSLDRPIRLRVIRRMRDQYLNEILSFRKKRKESTSSNPPNLSFERARSSNDGAQEKLKEGSEEQRGSRWHNIRVA